MNSIIKKVLVLLACVGLGLAGAAVAYVAIQYWFTNTGTIASPSLTIYINDILNETTIDWGLCEANSTYYFENMTVVNTGNTNLTVYIVVVDLPLDWILDWGGNETLLIPGAKVEGELALTIPASATSWPTWGFYLRGS